jgi:hypothetical protein
LAGIPHGRALASQSLVVEAGARGARIFAPVTNRGEAIGVLQLSLAQKPGEDVLADVALAAHALAYVVIANRRFTDLFEWANARFGSRSPPRSNIGYCLARRPARQGSSRSRHGWSPRATSPATRSTSRFQGSRTQLTATRNRGAERRCLGSAACKAVYRFDSGRRLYGSMFWFSRKKFVGSYARFSSTKRSYCRSP